ncbi:MAG: flavodoxin family protein [Anaerolineae bacterium]|nr:flavodoxin family protein [Anaerolineae bacterium]
MSSVLGIVGSARPWGNSEVLVRQALRGAEFEGAATSLLRLPTLHLEPCTGCMRCVIGGRPCPLDDDMRWLIDTIQAADGLVLAAPTYFLGPAAVVKLVLDRLLMVTGQLDQDLPPPRPAITVATAGLESWRGMTLPYLNALVGAFGYQPIDSVTAIAPGPGEILLDTALMERLQAAGLHLAQGQLSRTPAAANICPTCHSDAFAIYGDRMVCPICGRSASLHVHDGGIELSFETDTGSKQRWTPEGLREHMVDWVVATGPRYLSLRQEIKDRRRPLRQMAAEWLCPPSSAGRTGRR